MSETETFDFVVYVYEGLSIVCRSRPLPEDERTEEMECIETYGILDESGREVVPFIYDHIGSFQDGVAMVKSGRNYGFIDTTGKEVVPCEHHYARPFYDGLANVDGNIFVDKFGREVLRLPKELVPYDFSEGLAAVVDAVDCKRGYIDKTGRIVIPCRFDRAEEFQDGLALVAIGDRWFHIDKTGREVKESIPETSQREGSSDADNGVPF